MRVRELMRRQVVTVPETLPVVRLYDVLQGANVHGAPVVDDDRHLVGFVSQEDVLIGSLGNTPPRPILAVPDDFDGGLQVARAPVATEVVDGQLVRDIMTSPAIYIDQDADVADLARLLWEFRIHHVPVVVDDEVAGIVSSMDFCRIVGDGRFVELT
jgi:CBS domain-containing protein